MYHVSDAGRNTTRSAFAVAVDVVGAAIAVDDGAHAVPSTNWALTGNVRFTRKTSFRSVVVSPMMGTLIVRLVCPGVKVSVPLTAE